LKADFADFKESRWEQPEARGVPKKYCRITKQGLELLREAKELWFGFSADVGGILSRPEGG
jgi:DNA-binding PadR family transcriptional regulator